MRRRVLAVANPAAGFSPDRNTLSRVVKAFRRADPRSEIDWVRTAGPGDARRMAAVAAESGLDLVLSVGGDGTAHEVANGLIGTGTAMGVIPVGTMNLLARVLRIPIDPVAAASRLAISAASRTIHPGLVDGRVFLLMAGIGFDAWVLRELLEDARRKIGFRDYVRGAARALRTYPFPAVEVRAAGRTVQGHSVVVGRAPLYGGFLRPTPRADLATSRLEICVISGGAPSLVRTMASMWSGDHLRRPGVESILAQSVDVSAAGQPVPVQLDGELAGDLPSRFGISPLGLRLLA